MADREPLWYCGCDGCWCCKGYEAECTCDVDWEKVMSR